MYSFFEQSVRLHPIDDPPLLTLFPYLPIRNSRCLSLHANSSLFFGVYQFGVP